MQIEAKYYPFINISQKYYNKINIDMYCYSSNNQIKE